MRKIAKKDGGGVAIFYKEDIQAQPRQYIHNVTDLEFVLLKIDTPTNATIATVYRPPHYSLDKFLPNLRSLLDYLDMMRKNPVIICGDFNEDPLSPGRKAILELFQSKQYTQLITSATTDKHTLWTTFTSLIRMSASNQVFYRLIIVIIIPVYCFCKISFYWLKGSVVVLQCYPIRNRGH